MQEFEDNEGSSIPDFYTILTSTYALRNEVAEGFFNQEAPAKLDSDNYQAHFKNAIFKDDNMGPADIKETYEKCLKALR